MSEIDEEKRKQALNSTFINSEALSHFNLLKKEQMFLVQQYNNNNNNNNNIYRGSPTRQGGFQWGPHKQLLH